jgi:hypothetical protein
VCGAVIMKPHREIGAGRCNCGHNHHKSQIPPV